ncbi:ras family-domain-containing protein [Paraphoma chrysanthemicola]|nr:ras family-domain-containing protein [Paraphoma chrysanthemicola]
MDASPYTLAPIAQICSEGISKLVKTIREDWDGQDEMQLEIMLGLKDSKSRLDGWMSDLSEVEVSPSWTSGDPMHSAISRSLRLLAAQLEHTLPPESQDPLWQHLPNSATEDPPSTESSLQLHSAFRLAEDLREVEEFVSDTTTCLCSFKTALRITSTAIAASKGSSLASPNAAIETATYALADLDFEPGPLERAESDLYNQWRRWEVKNKTESNTPAGTRLEATQKVDSDSNDPQLKHGTTESSPEVQDLTEPQNLATIPKSSRKAKKLWSRSTKPLSTATQPSPPPPYELDPPSDTPALGHVSWMNRAGKPPSYSEAVKGSDYVRRKLVTVGTGAVGKTCANIVWMKGYFPEVYVPTVFENYVADIEFGSVHIEMAVWDTAGQEDYDRIRPLSYPDSHVIIINYGIDSPASLDNIAVHWISEVRHFCQGLPIVLAGLKGDLRHDQHTVQELAKCHEQPVTFQEGYNMAKMIGAAAFVECSAKTHEGVSAVYETATRLAISHGPSKYQKDQKCAVM